LAHKIPHDSITGMLNHNSMYHTVSLEVSRSRRYNNPLSLILMNINYSSCVDNSNSFSDEKIEQIRVMISQLLKDQIRWADIIGHLEHSDFALLLPETNHQSAQILINKLNKNIQNISLNSDYISYGISQWKKGDDVNLFIERAINNVENADLLVN